MTDKEKADVYDQIVNIINQAREDDENDEVQWDSSEILEKIENSL